MNKARKIATDWFLDIMERRQPGNKNVPMYKAWFETLSDEEFDRIMRDDSVVLPYYSANLHDKDLEMGSELAIGDELGINFFQRINITDPVTGIQYLSPIKYLIGYLAVRRQSQHASKGLSVVEDSVHVDSLTGQASGPSTATRISLPEITNLANMGLTHATQEFIDVRGGNEEGFRKAKRDMLSTGRYSIREVKELGTRPTVLATARALLLGMHFDSNL